MIHISDEPLFLTSHTYTRAIYVINGCNMDIGLALRWKLLPLIFVITYYKIPLLNYINDISRGICL